MLATSFARVSVAWAARGLGREWLPDLRGAAVLVRNVKVFVVLSSWDEDSARINEAACAVSGQMSVWATTALEVWMLRALEVWMLRALREAWRGVHVWHEFLARPEDTVAGRVLRWHVVCAGRRLNS